MMTAAGRYRSLQLRCCLSHPRRRGRLHSDHPFTFPFSRTASPPAPLPRSPPPASAGGVKPGEGSARRRFHPLFLSRLLPSSQAALAPPSPLPPTSNLRISKPSMAQVRPTRRIGSAQLVITDRSSSETSHFSLFTAGRWRRGESRRTACR